jgi:hypothetical protein
MPDTGPLSTIRPQLLGPICQCLQWYVADIARPQPQVHKFRLYVFLFKMLAFWENFENSGFWLYSYVLKNPSTVGKLSVFPLPINFKV